MQKILVCTDGSPYSDVCCQYAAWLAKRIGAAVEAMYVSDLRQFELAPVADLGGTLGTAPYENILLQLEQMEVQKSTMIEQSARARFQREGLGDRFQFHHLKGLVVDRLKDMEEKDPEIGLVVLGKRGENADFAAEHLGSAMERVVRASTKPCLVAPRKFTEVHRILLAYDGGKSCAKAIEYLVNSPVFKGLELHVVTVHEANRTDNSDDFVQLQALKHQLKAAGFSPKMEVRTGPAEDAISEYVAENHIDMLLMGAYGHSRIRYLLIGSTTTDLIRRCNVPVLLFR